jgi:rod shape-determining protein MreD
VGAVVVTPAAAARVSLVVFGFVCVQQTLMLDLRIGGVHPDIMILLPVSAGIVGGPGRGATMGFWSGLVADLFLPTPFGLSALVGCMVGFAVGMATVALDRSSWWLPLVSGALASIVFVLLYAVLGSILGEPQVLHVDLTRIVVVVSVVNAVLAVPATRLVGWALPEVSTEGIPTSNVGTW